MVTDLLQMVSFQGHGFWYWTSHTHLLLSVSAAKPVRIWGMQGWTEEEAGHDTTAMEAQLISLELRSWDGSLLFHFGVRGLLFSSFPISTNGWMWVAHGRRMEPRERLPSLKGNSKVPHGSAVFTSRSWQVSVPIPRAPWAAHHSNHYRWEQGRTTPDHCFPKRIHLS